MKNLKKRTFDTLIPKLYYLFILFLFSCSSDDGGGGTGIPRTSSTNIINIDLADTKQHIVGFGGCNSVFRGANNYPGQSDIAKAYGLGDNDLGLSIFRVSVPPSQSNWPAVATVAKYAQDQGAIVFASPWDVPPDMRDPEHDERRLLPSKYGDYVNHLNSFDDFMTNNGVNLHAISVQNEPDIGEWTQWTVFEVQDFMKNFAGDINNRVITPESFNFNRAYYNGLLSDAETRNNFDIVGGHIYGNGLGEIPQAEQHNKEIWMTEYLLNEFTDNISSDDWTVLTDEQKWDQTFDMLDTVHEAMESNWNAYVWWYLKRYYSFIGDGLEGSTEGEVLKRGFAFSHYSKYIRPGANRVGLSIDENSGIKLTAYEDGNTITLVVINENGPAATSQISIEGKTIMTATSFVTTLDSNREQRSVSVENNSAFPAILPSSVTTIILTVS